VSHGRLTRKSNRIVMLHMNKEQHEKKKEIKVNLNENMYIVGIE